MSLLVVGTVAFDDVETPYGRAEKIVGGAATYISLAAAYFTKTVNLVSVIGDDFPGLQTSRVGKSVIGSDKIDLPMTQMVDAGNALIQTFCNWKYRKE